MTVLLLYIIMLLYIMQYCNILRRYSQFFSPFQHKFLRNFPDTVYTPVVVV